MYHVFKYLKHMLSATNQHGVHSPFVYDYLTKCIYAKPKLKGSKKEHVLFKSIPYFSVEKFKINSKNSKLENRIFDEFGLRPSEKTPLDLIHIDHLKPEVSSDFEDKVHNNSMIFIADIHRTKKTSSLWETAIKSELITVSIDMFHCGVVFFRKEQVKEHFKIRI